MTRPVSRVTLDPATTTLGYVASYLVSHCGIQRHARANRHDPVLFQGLMDLVVVAQAHRAAVALSDGGNTQPEIVAGSPEMPPELVHVSTTVAADKLGLTARALQFRCERGAIPAKKVDGRWQIRRDELDRLLSQESVKQ